MIDKTNTVSAVCAR